ncbi:MAG TPA: ribosome small subunit-dependent GTPase A [Anaerolineaceae bacterium]
MNLPRNTSDDEGSVELLGIVYKKNIGLYSVHSGDRVIPCALSTRLRKEFIYTTVDPSSQHRRVMAVKEIDHSDPIAIGDQVRLTEAGDGTGLIQGILPRRNRLSRRTAVAMPGAHAFEQVVAANIDQVVPVFAISQPEPHWAMLDRYLASAESFDLPALICITKLDLIEADADGSLVGEIQTIAHGYRQIGYPVISISVRTGEGLDELREALHDKVSVFVGKSGVGKTSLLNALQPGLGLHTQAVNRATGKGRHATTWLEMFPLDLGGAILDTPGMREVGLWDVNRDELAFLFPEMRPLMGKCRFGVDCQHDEEPGCAIRQAVVEGEISPRRYQSYLRLREG